MFSPERCRVSVSRDATFSYASGHAGLRVFVEIVSYPMLLSVSTSPCILPFVHVLSTVLSLNVLSMSKMCLSLDRCHVFKYCICDFICFLTSSCPPSIVHARAFLYAPSRIYTDVDAPACYVNFCLNNTSCLLLKDDDDVPVCVRLAGEENVSSSRLSCLVLYMAAVHLLRTLPCGPVLPLRVYWSCAMRSTSDS